jgi:PAS domain S-box-containing protein
MSVPADREESSGRVTNKYERKGLRKGGLKKMEQTLRSALEFRERLMEAASNAIGALDSGGKFVLANHRLAEITGYSVEALLGRPFHTLVAPEDVARINELFMAALKNGLCASQVEAEILREDGATRTINYSLHPLLLEDGEPGVFIAAEDITERKRADALLHETVARNKAILKALPDLMFLTTKDGVFLDFYAKESGVLFLPPEQFIGKNVREVFPGDLGDVLARCFEQATRSSEPVIHEYSLPLDNRQRYYEARVVSCAGGRVLSIVRDITDRKRAEEALRNIAEGISAVTGESFLRSLVQYLVKILRVNYAIVGELVEPEREIVKAIICADGQILEPFEYRLANTPCENVIKQQLCCYPEGVQRQFPKDKLLAEMDVESYLGTPLRDSFGRTLGLLVVMSRKPLDDRKLATSMLQIFGARASAEIERKRGEAALLASEESLRRSHARVQDLAGKLITAQEEERKHLSRELHDDLNQKLASLAITIGYLKRHLPEPAEFINHQLTDLEDRIFSLSNDIRQLSHELHPAVLEHIGLHMALESYCGEFSGREGIPVALDIEEGITEIHPRIALCLYRIAQEALRNVAKHSGAASARVTLSTANGGVRLVISDQGIGYDYSQARAKGGLGLISMEERVRLLGGSFQVITQPHKGTEVRVYIPNQ